MDMEKRSTKYEYTVVALNFFIVGFVALDRILIANLFPWVMPALKIDFTKAGLIMAILSLTWSVSAIVFGGVSDKIGRKIIIIPATIIFSLMSWMSGMVTSLGQLLGIRAFMGVAEGAYYPTAIATVAEESKPERRATNIGIMLSAFNIVGMIICPIYATYVAVHWGWRTALYLTVIPGIILALLFWKFVKEPASTAAKKQARKDGTAKAQTESGELKGWVHIFTYRNVIVGALGAIFCMGWSFTILTFGMSFFTQGRQLPPQTAGFTMAMLGIGGALGSFAIPFLSDQLGRKAGIIFAGFCTVIATFALAYWSVSLPSMMLCFFLMGFFGYGIFPVLTGALPYESVPLNLTASAVGFIVFIGEIIGAAVAPAVGGILADAYGLNMTMAGAGISVFVATVCAFALKETAPKILARRGVGTPK
jgi:MFS family permease